MSMPKTTPAPVKMSSRKTERSHEENQERAYIAASRRADRSIEARVQSARMASEIHKKRTGKSFKISEEIVMKEEMYEEEDDDLPRQYRMLAAHLQTSSPEMNHRLSAYLTNQVAMASLARQQEVNRLFAEQFPGASQFSSQLNNSIYYQPLQASPTSPVSPQYVPYNPSPTTPTFPLPRDRSHSMSQPSMMSPMVSPRPSGMHQPSQSPVPRHGSVDGQLASPALSSSGINTPEMQVPLPYHSTFAQSMAPIDPAMVSHPAPTTSPFTSELPPETKMMANLDFNDPMYSIFMGGAGELTGTESLYNYPGQTTSAFPGKDHPIPSSESDMLGGGNSTPIPAMRPAPFEMPRLGTPGDADAAWDAWINNEAFDYDGVQEGLRTTD